MKKTGLVIAAAAAAMILSGCASRACNAPENTPICETPCAAPMNTCKCMSSCKAMHKCCAKKHKRHHHRRCSAENTQAQMNA